MKLLVWLTKYNTLAACICVHLSFTKCLVQHSEPEDIKTSGVPAALREGVTVELEGGWHTICSYLDALWLYVGLLLVKWRTEKNLFHLSQQNQICVCLGDGVG